MFLVPVSEERAVILVLTAFTLACFGAKPGLKLSASVVVILVFRNLRYGVVLNIVVILLTIPD